jgi:hypothetical protein
VARPREAVGCRTLICRKADSGQLNDLPTLRPSGVGPVLEERQSRDYGRSLRGNQRKARGHSSARGARPESCHSAHFAASGFEVWAVGKYDQLRI